MVPAKRGQICVCETIKPAGGVDKYKLARVLKCTREGKITHVEPYGELSRASSTNTLRYHNVSRTFSATGAEGDRLAKGDLEFPQEWESLDEATMWIRGWLKEND